jgi:hypothetical protein
MKKVDLDDPFLGKKRRARLEKEIKLKKESDMIKEPKEKVSSKFTIFQGKAMGRDNRPKRVGFRFSRLM